MKLRITAVALATLVVGAYVSPALAQSGSRSLGDVAPATATNSYYASGTVTSQPAAGQPVVGQPATPAGVGQDYFASGGTACDASGAACDSGCISNTCDQPCRYIRLFGGWNQLEEFEAPITAGASGAQFGTSDGWAVGGSIGRYLRQNLRAELEFTYRNNSLDAVVGNGPPIAITGDVQAYSLMSNLIYDLNNFSVQGFRPYVGGGLGLAVVDGTATFAAIPFSIDGSALGYQGFAGLERQIGRVKLFGEYRYFGTTDIDITGGGNTASDDYQAQNVFVGIQISR